jgi:hypothetical protein
VANSVPPSPPEQLRARVGGSASAEGQCDRLKQAVATYGYAAARKHALENYGKEAVAFGDKCLEKAGASTARRGGSDRLSGNSCPTQNPPSPAGAEL